ncbi:MAG: radical SAM protein, partial [Chthoniobacterales bacterium]
TDPYQPIERRLKITRRCLEVLARFRNPVAIITKNRLVTRDIDVLGELAADNAVAVNISITSLDRKLQRILEPRTSPPAARLDAVAQLHAAGIPVGVMVAPIIPAITDHEAYVILRLPWAVAPIFERWLEEHFPDRKEKVLGRIREMRGGGDKVYDSRWTIRQTGQGIFAEQIETMFEVARRRAGINGRPALSTAGFRRPNEQLTLL